MAPGPQTERGGDQVRDQELEVDVHHGVDAEERVELAAQPLRRAVAQHLVGAVAAQENRPDPARLAQVALLAAEQRHELAAHVEAVHHHRRGRLQHTPRVLPRPLPDLDRLAPGVDAAGPEQLDEAILQRRAVPHSSPGTWSGQLSSAFCT